MSILKVDTIAPLTGDSMTISGSLLFTTISGSFSGSFNGDGSGLTGIIASAGTASYIALSNVDGSSSLATRLTGLESFSSSLDATFATDSQLNAATSSFNSFSSSINSFTASQQTLNNTFATTGSNQFSGSQTITGSFGVSGSIILIGSNIITGSFGVSGSTTLVGSTTITGSLGVSSGITGSLLGTSSFATSASFASTSPYSGLQGTVPTWNQDTTGTATNATNFNVEADDSTNSTHFIIFTGGATGNQRPNSDTALTYNPSTNLLSAGCFVETSALRCKDNIHPINSPLDKVKQLKPVTFDWKHSGKNDIGFIAEEVNEVLPNLIHYNEEGEVEGMNYSKITSLLAAAIQEQQEQINKLKQEINTLKNK